MKNVLTVVLVVVALTINAQGNEKNNTANKTEIIVGVFDGYDADDGYSFLVEDKVEKTESTMFFETIKEDVLKNFNLKTNIFEGKKFEITYEISIHEIEEDGIKDTYERYKIVSLKQM